VGFEADILKTSTLAAPKGFLQKEVGEGTVVVIKGLSSLLSVCHSCRMAMACIGDLRRCQFHMGKNNPGEWS
jgi:hypothetical protein